VRILNHSRPENETRTARQIKSKIGDLVQIYPELLLLKAGRFEDTPLHFACRFNLPLFLIKLIAQRCPKALRLTDRDGRTPLNLVCMRSETSCNVAEILIEMDPKAVRKVDNDGWVPFHAACYSCAPMNINLFGLTSFQPLFERIYAPFYPLFLSWPSSTTSGGCETPTQLLPRNTAPDRCGRTYPSS
jgi:hypothetical protein